MLTKGKTLEEKVEWMSEEILLLREDISELSTRLAKFELGAVLIPHSPRVQGEKKAVKTDPQKIIPEDAGWTQLSHEVLLPRIAAISFMLVVALMLRTITDNGMIDMKLGSYLGTVYAIGLIGWGWFKYSRNDKLAPVFPTCGVVLLYAIIFETHTHFESLSSTSVYTILLVAEAVVVIIGLRCRAGALLYLATFGSTFTGIGINFPAPLYACLAAVLLVNNVAGYLAASYRISTSLRWYTLFFTLMFWSIWSYKLNFALRFEDDATNFGLYWSMPILFFFYAYYLFCSVRQSRQEKIGPFYNILPVITAAGTFFVVLAVVGPWKGLHTMIGYGGVIVSALYMGLVNLLSKRHQHPSAVKEFVIAATILLIQGVYISVPPLLAVPILVVAAAVLTKMANRWKNGGVRLLSYLFQLFILVFALKMDLYMPGNIAWGLGFIIAGCLAGCSLWLYDWCRKNFPNYDSVFFSLFDKKDLTASIFLIVGLVHIFFMFRFVSYGMLTATIGGNISIAFSCSQSIIINLGVIGLMIAGLRLKNKEMLIVSIVVVFVAATKVFFFDLFRTQGVPLVLSVFSFGLVAVASSMTMKKWQDYRENSDYLSLGRKNYGDQINQDCGKDSAC